MGEKYDEWKYPCDDIERRLNRLELKLDKVISLLNSLDRHNVDVSLDNRLNAIEENVLILTDEVARLTEN